MQSVSGTDESRFEDVEPFESQSGVVIDEKKRVVLRRSAIEKFFDLMKMICLGYNRPTQLKSKANLNWNVLKQYLRFLETKEFIVKEELTPGKRTYRLSEKGDEALKTYLQLRDQFGSLLDE